MTQIRYKLKDGTEQTMTGCTGCGEAATTEKPVVALIMGIFICEDCVHLMQNIFDEDKALAGKTDKGE